jgi:DNA-binding PadR family transcriptional regulator
MSRRTMSELEGCVLGLVELAGSTTAYAVCSVFLKSPSPQWSGSAGAIYPLVERLERAKLIRGTHGVVGRRGRRMLKLTAKGRAAFQSWMGSLSDRVAGVPPDPLRTRMYFLDLLPEKRRRKFVKAALMGADENLSKVREDCKNRKSAGGVWYLAALGALHSMEARRDWLRSVQKGLDRSTR